MKKTLSDQTKPKLHEHPGQMQWIFDGSEPPPPVPPATVPAAGPPGPPAPVHVTKHASRISLTSASIGATIRQLRKARGMTLVQLSGVLGIPPDRLSNIEHQKEAVSTAFYAKIVGLLGGSISVALLAA